MLSIDNMFNYAVQLQVNTHLCTQKWIEKCLAFTRHSINLSACIQAGRKKTERKSMNRIESHAPVSFTWRYDSSQVRSINTCALREEVHFCSGGRRLTARHASTRITNPQCENDQQVASLTCILKAVQVFLSYLF